MAETDLEISQIVGGLDGSASGYFKIGNMMIQWGITALITTSSGYGTWYYADSAVTFPVAFKNPSTPTVITSAGESAAMCWASSYSITRTGFSARLLCPATNITDYVKWVAIGLIA